MGGKIQNKNKQNKNIFPKIMCTKYHVHSMIYFPLCLSTPNFLDSDWIDEPRDLPCSTQLQTSFFKPKDSFIYPILDYTGPLSYLHVWMPSIGNSFAYELHLFDRFCASQRVTKVWRNVFPVVPAISLKIRKVSSQLQLSHVLVFSLYSIAKSVPGPFIPQGCEHVIFHSPDV